MINLYLYFTVYDCTLYYSVPINRNQQIKLTSLRKGTEQQIHTENQMGVAPILLLNKH